MNIINKIMKDQDATNKKFKKQQDIEKKEKLK